jgi:5'-deoxynucleotidase YfbR-like HD superfamily hydrolase
MDIKAYNPNSLEAEFWHRFCDCANSCLVPRIGFPIFGYHKDVPVLYSPADRPESDAEHSYLLICCIMLCQDIFMVGSDCDEDSRRQYELAAIHDLPEYAHGCDTPDDGSRDESTKNQEEYSFVCRFTERFVPVARRVIRNDTLDFQRKDNFVFLMDKFQFIMRQLWLCSYDICGSMDYKLDNYELSDSDRMYMELTGESLSVINTAARFLDSTRGIAGRDLCIRLLEEAFMQVFHAVPAALEQFY